MVKSRSSSDGEEEVLIVSSGEEEDNEHTIFSSEEDEPEDPPPRSFKKEEACGSGKAQPVKSGTKRPSEGTSKRAKKISTAGEKKMGANLSKRRLFIEEDEIVLLQGMIDSKADKGKNPLEDKHGFFESIKDSISFEVTWGQFKDKINGMKRKYMGIEKSGAFSLNAHEQKCFELSKVIWGAEGIAVECTIKSNGESRKSERIKELNCSKGGDEEESPVGVTESDWFENSFLVPSIEILGVDSVKQLWSKVPIETKKKTEEKMKLLHANELECKKVEETLKTMKDQCVLQRLALLREVTSLITEAN